MKIIWFIRSLVMTFFIPIWVLLLGPSAILCHALFKRRDIDNWHLKTWGRLNCKCFGVSVRVTGIENIPDEGCLFLFNHSSFFDVFALASALPNIRFGAKAELFKIPVFAQAMRAMGTIPIARQNREEVYKVYEEAKVRFKNKEQFALSPEGGRFYGAHLANFKAGPFLFAMSAEAPLVPLVILGAYECLPKGHIIPNPDRKSRDIHIHILKPVATRGMTERGPLQQIIYKEMDAVWAPDHAQRHT